jgi:uncharacterized protein YbjT (DUF2867 family)
LNNKNKTKLAIKMDNKLSGGEEEEHVPLSSFVPCFLQVTLLQGKDLRSSKININGKGDPFVILQILKGDTPDPSKGIRSRINRNTMEPFWNDQFQFKDVNTASDKLALMAYDFVRIGKNSSLGSAVIPLSDLVKNVPKDVTVKLSDPPNPKVKAPKERGTLQLILTATDNEREEPEVIKEGYLKKEGGLSVSKSLVWQNRYLIIRQGVAHYKEFKVSEHFKGSIKELSKCKVQESHPKDGAKIISKNHFYFTVSSDHRSFNFKVPTDKERQEWIAAFVKAGCTYDGKGKVDTSSSVSSDSSKGGLGSSSSSVGSSNDKGRASSIVDELQRGDQSNSGNSTVASSTTNKTGGGGSIILPSPPSSKNSSSDNMGNSADSTISSSTSPKPKSLLTEALKASNQELSLSSSPPSAMPNGGGHMATTTTTMATTTPTTSSTDHLTIFVTGALGNCGFSAIKELLNHKKKNVTIKAGVRSIERAEELRGLDVELVEIDAERPETLITAFQGVNRLFIIPTSSQNRTEHVRNYVEAAKKARVQHTVLLSLFVAGAVRPEHKNILFAREFKEMEDHLERTNLNWTRLRATFFIQNFFGFQDSISRGILSLPIANGAFSPLDLDDVSRLATFILMKNDNDIRPFVGKTFILTGPESLDGAGLAREISRGIAAGRPAEEAERNPVNVQYVASNIDEWKQNSFEMGFPEWHANGLFELLQVFARNEADFVSGDFQAIMGKEPNSVFNFFRENVSAFT